MNSLDALLAAGYGPNVGGWSPPVIGAYNPPVIGAGGMDQRMVTPGTPQQGTTQHESTLRRLMCGIPITSYATTITADIICNVSEPFRPDRLMLSTAAQALHVTNLRVGTKSMNVSSNPVSGNCFSEQAINNDLSGYTALPGVGATLTLYNSTGATVVASGGFFGWSLV